MSERNDFLALQSLTKGPFLTRSEVADLFSVGAAQIRELVEMGHIVTVPGRLYFHRAEILRYCREGGPAKRTQTGTICIAGARCPISDCCKFAAAAAAIDVGQRIEVDVIRPLGEWTTGSCSEFEPTEAAAMPPADAAAVEVDA